LHELGALITEKEVNGPAVLIIGEVAAYAKKEDLAEIAELNERRIA
jgi:siroheme synthase